MPEHPGRDFQIKTRYKRNAMEPHELDWRGKPPEYKFYPHAPVIALPDPEIGDQERPPVDFWRCVSGRRSVRAFASTPLTMLQLSRILWAAGGLTAAYMTPGGQGFFRAAPSAGALYPIETYLVVNRVEGMEPGLYHYRAAGMEVLERPVVEGSHSLEQLRTGDLSDAIRRAALDQPVCAKAGAVLVWTAVFARSTWKYRQRAYRYVYLDVGHIAAHVSLAAVAEKLGSCQVAAFYDDEADALLELDGMEESTLYMTAVGVPARPFGGMKRVDVRRTARPKE